MFASEDIHDPFGTRREGHFVGNKQPTPSPSQEGSSMDKSNTRKRPAWWVDDPRCEPPVATTGETGRARRMATAGDIMEAKRMKERDRQHMEEAMSDPGISRSCLRAGRSSITAASRR
jgi:hypothetical protein